MKKLALTLTATALLLTGLAGCNNKDNNTLDEGASGYSRGFGVNEGTRGFGYHRGDGKNDQIGMYEDNGVDLGRDKNGVGRDGMNGKGDRDSSLVKRNDQHNHNYRAKGRAENGKIHGQSTHKNVGKGYYDSDNGRMSREINDSLSAVRGLRNSHVIVHENDVIIGVEHDGAGENMDRVIKEHVKNRVGNRNVHVVTDRDQVNNIRSLNNRLEKGEPIEEIGDTINDMLRDLGNAIQRPFERNR